MRIRLIDNSCLGDPRRQNQSDVGPAGHLGRVECCVNPPIRAEIQQGNNIPDDSYHSRAAHREIVAAARIGVGAGLSVEPEGIMGYIVLNATVEQRHRYCEAAGRGQHL